MKKLDSQSPEFRDLITSLTNTKLKLPPLNSSPIPKEQIQIHRVHRANTLPPISDLKMSNISFLLNPIISKKVGTFTGLKDTDLLILMELNDNDLFKVCSINKYLNSLCNNEYFWYNRIVKKYGEDVAKQTNKNTWKKYYIFLIKSNIKLYFDRHNFFYLSSKKLNQGDIVLDEKIIIPRFSPKYYVFIYGVRILNNTPVFTDKKELEKYFKTKNIKLSVIRKFTKELNLYI
jgi:hypothetical protein